MKRLFHRIRRTLILRGKFGFSWKYAWYYAGEFVAGRA